MPVGPHTQKRNKDRRQLSGERYFQTLIPTPLLDPHKPGTGVMTQDMDFSAFLPPCPVQAQPHPGNTSPLRGRPGPSPRLDYRDVL